MKKETAKNRRANANRVIDCLMTLALPLLMAYSLIGETFHEITGTLMLPLFLTHAWQHRRWWKTVPRGRYTPYRTLLTALDLILLVLMLAQPFSGIAMSHHLYTFLPLGGVAATVREIHLLLGYWSFVLLSFHLGLHMDMMLPAAFRGKTVGRIAVLGISLYGIYAFIRRELPAYMFRQTMFAFFDFEEPLVFFLLDYLAIMVLFAALGYCIGRIIKRRTIKEITNGTS